MPTIPMARLAIAMGTPRNPQQQVGIDRMPSTIEAIARGWNAAHRGPTEHPAGRIRRAAARTHRAAARTHREVRTRRVARTHLASPGLDAGGRTDPAAAHIPGGPYPADCNGAALIRRPSWADDSLSSSAMAAQGSVTSAGFWDLDEALPALGVGSLGPRAWRACGPSRCFPRRSGFSGARSRPLPCPLPGVRDDTRTSPARGRPRRRVAADAPAGRARARRGRVAHGVHGLGDGDSSAPRCERTGAASGAPPLPSRSSSTPPRSASGFCDGSVTSAARSPSRGAVLIEVRRVQEATVRREAHCFQRAASSGSGGSTTGVTSRMSTWTPSPAFTMWTDSGRSPCREPSRGRTSRSRCPRAGRRSAGARESTATSGCTDSAPLAMTSSAKTPVDAQAAREGDVEGLVGPLEQLARSEVVDGHGAAAPSNAAALRRRGPARASCRRRSHGTPSRARRPSPRTRAAASSHSSTAAHESITVGESGCGTLRLRACAPMPFAPGAPTCEESWKLARR